VDSGTSCAVGTSFLTDATSGNATLESAATPAVPTTVFRKSRRTVTTSYNKYFEMKRELVNQRRKNSVLYNV
jgi:hypothetical protein